MFCGGHNSEFSEQNFAHKSEHDKRVIQRNSRKDFAAFFERAGEGIGRIWVGRKLLWSAPCTRKKRAWGSRENAGVWAAKKAWESVCDGCSEWLERRADAYYSRENLDRMTVHTDGWKAYDGLILNGYNHYQVFHHENEFARGKSHVNGIECFWCYAKRRLSKFNGLTDAKFILLLKESECKFTERIFGGKL